MNNQVIWRLVIIDNFDDCQVQHFVDVSSLEKAVEYYLTYSKDKQGGLPKWTILGPVPIGNLTF